MPHAPRRAHPARAAAAQGADYVTAYCLGFELQVQFTCIDS
jgi:hypothetical protein